MPHGKIRQVIEETRFRLELRRLIKTAERADEFVDGAKWLLARDPMQGKQIGNSMVWFLAMKQKVGILPVVIYYTFDEGNVNLLSIQETIYGPE